MINCIFQVSTMVFKYFPEFFIPQIIFQTFQSLENFNFKFHDVCVQIISGSVRTLRFRDLSCKKCHSKFTGFTFTLLPLWLIIWAQHLIPVSTIQIWYFFFNLQIQSYHFDIQWIYTSMFIYTEYRQVIMYQVSLLMQIFDRT